MTAETTPQCKWNCWGNRSVSVDTFKLALEWRNQFVLVLLFLSRHFCFDLFNMKARARGSSIVAASLMFASSMTQVASKSIVHVVDMFLRRTSFSLSCFPSFLVLQTRKDGKQEREMSSSLFSWKHNRFACRHEWLIFLSSKFATFRRRRLIAVPASSPSPVPYSRLDL